MNAEPPIGKILIPKLPHSSAHYSGTTTTSKSGAFNQPPTGVN
jgi:hypothetical protein